MRTWRILAQVITCDFCCFSQRAPLGVYSPCSHGSAVRWGGHMQCPCVHCLCLAGRVSFSTRAPGQSLTTANQSAKDIDPYFKSQLHVADPDHSKPVLILPNGSSEPWERAHDRNQISAVGGIRTHNLLIDSPAHDHWAITSRPRYEDHERRSQSRFKK